MKAWGVRINYKLKFCLFTTLWLDMSQISVTEIGMWVSWGLSSHSAITRWLEQDKFTICQLWRLESQVKVTLKITSFWGLREEPVPHPPAGFWSLVGHPWCPWLVEASSTLSPPVHIAGFLLGMSCVQISPGGHQSFGTGDSPCSSMISFFQLKPHSGYCGWGRSSAYTLERVSAARGDTDNPQQRKKQRRVVENPSPAGLHYP